MNLRESLNALDNKAIDEGTQYYDLRDMFESVTLTTEEKQNLARLIESNDQTAIASALTRKLEGLTIGEIADSVDDDVELEECDKAILESVGEGQKAEIQEAIEEMLYQFSEFRRSANMLATRLENLYNINVLLIEIDDLGQSISNELEDIQEELFEEPEEVEFEDEDY